MCLYWSHSSHRIGCGFELELMSDYCMYCKYVLGCSGTGIEKKACAKETNTETQLSYVSVRAQGCSELFSEPLCHYIAQHLLFPGIPSSRAEVMCFMSLGELERVGRL